MSLFPAGRRDVGIDGDVAQIVRSYWAAVLGVLLRQEDEEASRVHDGHPSQQPAKYTGLRISLRIK